MSGVFLFYGVTMKPNEHHAKLALMAAIGGQAQNHNAHLLSLSGESEALKLAYQHHTEALEILNGECERLAKDLGVYDGEQGSE